MTITTQTMTGYFIPFLNKAIFLETTATRKTKKHVYAMIEAIGRFRGLSKEMIDSCKADPASYKKIQHDMALATIETKYTNGQAWYSVRGEFFGGGYDLDEIIILKEA